MSIETQYAKLFDAPLVLDNGGAVINAKHRRFGIKGDGTTEIASHFADLVDAAVYGGHRIYFPPGTYKLPAGETIPVESGVHYSGAGREKTVITCEDAYAFEAPNTAATGLVIIEGLSAKLRTGSSEGGAVRCIGATGVYHSQWLLRELYGEQVTANDSPDPVFHLGGWIGCTGMSVQAQKGELGIHIDGSGFAANSNTLFDCRAVSNSVAGIMQTGGLRLRVLNGIVESNDGYGIDLVDSPGAIIQGMHLEDNNGHIRFRGTANGCGIYSNDFFYHRTGGTKHHIELVGPTTPAAMSGVLIGMNRRVDLAPGHDLWVGNTVSVPTLFANYNLDDVFMQNPNAVYQAFGQIGQNQWVSPIVQGGIQMAGFDPYYNTQRPTFRGRRRSGQTSDLFFLDDESGNTLFRIDKDGVAHLGDGGSQDGLVRQAATGVMRVSGGTTGALGGNVQMYGESHATLANNLLLRSGTNTRVQLNGTGMGFFGATPVAKPTGVAVTAAGIHAALVSLGLIAS